MNARELLKEARVELDKVHDHLMELTAKLPMQYFGLVDGNIIQAEDCLISQLDAYLAAPSESAMEMVRKIRADHEVVNDQDCGPVFNLSDSDAAALIEGLQRRVPRKMCEHLYNAGVNSVLRPPRPNVVDEITSEFGVKVEG